MESNQPIDANNKDKVDMMVADIEGYLNGKITGRTRQSIIGYDALVRGLIKNYKNVLLFKCRMGIIFCLCLDSKISSVLNMQHFFKCANKFENRLQQQCSIIS